MSTAPTSDLAERSSLATCWRLDPVGSKAEFRVPHFWGLVTVGGHFDRIDGVLDIDENGQRQIELTIDAASLDTGIRKRDKHLRSADFFDAERNPEVRFHSTRISDPGDGPLRVDGELVAAGNRVALSLEPTLEQSDGQLRIDTSTLVDQRQLGMTWSPLGMTRTPVTLHVHALLRRER
ncbi:MAG: YceI family protein [Solirubrobacteraceae bacterium]